MTTVKHKPRKNRTIKNRTRKQKLNKGDIHSTSNRNFETELIKRFKTHTDKYKPQDDFYSYINHNAIKVSNKFLKTERPYYFEFDNFTVIQNKVYYQLIDIVKQYVRENRSKSQNVNNVYKSLSLNYLNDATIETTIKDYVTTIDKRISTGNLYNLLGRINRNEVISWGCPLVWNVIPDEKNVSQFHSTISSCQLSLYDVTLYFDDPTDKIHVRNHKQLVKRKFLQFIDKMFKVCLGKSHSLDAMDVWNCESQIVNIFVQDSIQEDENAYNILTHSEGLKYGFDWNEMARQIGYTRPPNKFRCYSLNYLNGVMKLLTTDNTWMNKQWRTYYLYIAFRQMIRFHSKWRYIHYSFFESFLKGQASILPREIFPVFGFAHCFNTLLCNEYIKEYKAQSYNDYTINIANSLLAVYKNIIQKNTWLSSSTKSSALNKLDNIKLIIGSPDVLRKDPNLDYSSKNGYQNVRKCAYWRSKQLIKLDGTSTKDVDIPVIDWNNFKFTGKQSFIVNAFYTPTENSICIPQAYIQKPFIDLEKRGIEYNLAYIGYTLAHEMSHCLDDSGSKYNANGNLQNWWTNSDRKIYNSKINDVIKQYNHFALMDGNKFDATSSVGEDLADISGLMICEQYLSNFQQKNSDITFIRELSFKMFYMYIAIQGSQSISRKSLDYKFISNPHPLEKYRVNCGLSRLKLFNSIYNIEKEDKMYWKQNNLAIW